MTGLLLTMCAAILLTFMKDAGLQIGSTALSMIPDIVLLLSTIGAAIMWLRERHKRKYGDIKARQDIIDELIRKNDENVHDILELRKQINTLADTVNKQGITIKNQEEEMRSLKEENRVLRERQQKLIAENGQLKGELETIKRAGERKTKQTQ